MLIKITNLIDSELIACLCFPWGKKKQCEEHVSEESFLDTVEHTSADVRKRMTKTQSMLCKN